MIRKRLFKDMTVMAALAKRSAASIGLSGLIAAVMIAGGAMSAQAAGWRQLADGRWWYATNDDGTAWYANEWQWIDGNGDGVAESYCFDGNGYMYANTTTPDGYTVNADGAWTENGAVQTKTVGVAAKKPDYSHPALASNWFFEQMNKADDDEPEEEESQAPYTGGETASEMQAALNGTYKLVGKELSDDGGKHTRWVSYENLENRWHTDDVAILADGNLQTTSHDSIVGDGEPCVILRSGDRQWTWTSDQSTGNYLEYVYEFPDDNTMKLTRYSRGRNFFGEYLGYDLSKKQ